MDKDELSDLLKKRMKLAYEKLKLEIDRDLYNSMCHPGMTNWAPMMPMGELEKELTKQAFVESHFSLTEIEEAKKIIEDMKDA